MVSLPVLLVSVLSGEFEENKFFLRPAYPYRLLEQSAPPLPQ